jgi:hypothetical protein
MSSVIFDRLPMSPQSNNLYSGKAIRFPSKELKQYKKAMDDWRKEHLGLVCAARAALVAPLPEFQSLLRVDRYFALPAARIFTKDGTAQKLDASNRVKAFDDALADILQLDDRWFFSGTAEKVLCKPGTRPILWS